MGKRMFCGGVKLFGFMDVVHGPSGHGMGAGKGLGRGFAGSREGNGGQSSSMWDRNPSLIEDLGIIVKTEANSGCCCMN
ncbi:hypothetical protein F0562_032474 [Nyssa sinensis]|uniref:Uncharacterized protein n=1 Tax=Nyssa sinensis TaxID=561372 RepID=A0A5J5ATY3_9ASTE|nr:hypothetical protein F0562_032474 [Nyssa sinensis]